MRQAVTAAPAMTAAAFAGEAFSCARAHGAACAVNHIVILLDAILMASIFVILGILCISLLGLISLLLITTLVVLLVLPRRLRDRRSRFP